MAANEEEKMVLFSVISFKDVVPFNFRGNHNLKSLLSGFVDSYVVSTCFLVQIYRLKKSITCWGITRLTTYRTICLKNL